MYDSDRYTAASVWYRLYITTPRYVVTYRGSCGTARRRIVVTVINSYAGHLLFIRLALSARFADLVSVGGLLFFGKLTLGIDNFTTMAEYRATCRPISYNSIRWTALDSVYVTVRST